MIKKYIIILAALGFLFIEYRYSLSDNKNTDDDKLPVKVMPFRTTAGWGYKIDVDGKTFIRQDYIPAIQGNKGFRSPEDALKVGQLLVEKIKKRKRPIVTVDELKGMRIKNI